MKCVRDVRCDHENIITITVMIMTTVPACRVMGRVGGAATV
eukprot:COSAG06_NODE_41772_length_388_cov_0.307958_1_plen_41_part_00